MKKFLAYLMVAIILSVALSSCNRQQVGNNSNISSDATLSKTDSLYSSQSGNADNSALSEGSNQSQNEGTEGIKEGENRKPREDVIVRTLDSGVVVNAAVSVTPTVDFSQLSIFEGELQRLSIDPVANRLVGEDYTEIRQETKESVFSDAEYVLLEGADGTVLSSTESALSYTSPRGNEIVSYLWLEKGSSDYNGDAFLTGEEFSFGTQQECFNVIKEVLNSLNVQVCDDFICYSVDNEIFTEEAQQYRNKIFSQAREMGLQTEDGSLISEEELFQDFPEVNYTSDDDCYYYIIFPSIDGIPVTREENGIFENGGSISGSVIEAIYSHEGIIQLYLNSIYHVNEKSHDEGGMDLEDALAWLDEKYNEIIIDGEYIVQEISLEYVPISKGDRIHVELVPAWRFCINHTMRRAAKDNPYELIEISVYEQVMVNAVTGKEIVRGVGGI